MIRGNMKQQEDSEKKPRPTYEQQREIRTYPPYWQGTLNEAVQPGESVKEVYERLKDFEDMI